MSVDVAMIGRMITSSPPPDPGRAEWRWILGGVTAVVVALLLGESARTSEGAVRAALVAGQTLSTGLAFAIPQLRQWRASRAEASAEEREIEARVETRMAINDALDPVLRLLGRITATRDARARDTMAAQAVTLVLATASEFIGPPRSRACWFRLEPGPPRRLLPVEHAGRAGQPITMFVSGSTAGDAALSLVLGDDALRCEDVASAPPPGWSLQRDPDYRTFIAVAVAGADEAFGMLTLDALEPGTLSADDEGLLRLMAGLLALALSQRADR